MTLEQFAGIEKVINALPGPTVADKYADGWLNALAVVLDAIRRELVIKVEVAPTATATGTIEGLADLAKRTDG